VSEIKDRQIAKAPESVETERVRGEAICERHYDDLARLLGDERVMATLSADGQALSEERIRERLENHQKDWVNDGFGFWLWWDKESGDFVGRGGLRRIEVEGQPEVEIAYALVPEFWNLGIATEVAGYTLRVAFDDLGLDSVVAMALVRNAASRWVMEKIGMEYERDFMKLGQQHSLYRIRR